MKIYRLVNDDLVVVHSVELNNESFKYLDFKNTRPML